MKRGVWVRKLSWIVAAAGLVLGLSACEGDKKSAGADGAKQETSKEGDAEGAKAEGAGGDGDEGASAEADGAKAGDEALPDSVKESRKYGHVPIAGETTPEEVMEKFPRWKKAREEATADEQVGAKLGEVDEGAKVMMLFGTWCKDCHRELPRLWAALSHAGDDLPFEVTYIGLDEQFQAGQFDLTPYAVERIPTIIVERDDEEVGRIVEKTEDPVERELLALLTGEKEGLVSNSEAVLKKQ